MYDAASGGYHIGNGAARVYNGDNWGFLEVATGGLQTLGSVTSASELAQPKLGGGFGELDRTLGDRNHSPARAVIKAAGGDPQVSPAFVMEVADHVRTASHGGTGPARAFRAEQLRLVRNGDVAGAINMDVRDVATNPRILGDYRQGIQEMLNYARRAGYTP